MNAHTSTGSTAAGMNDITARLTFFKRVRDVVAKIARVETLESLTQAAQEDLCELFNADRITLYTVGEDGKTIVAKVKVGLDEVKELRLPITPKSIAGYVTLKRQYLNITDVYDQAELSAIDRNLHHLQEVDQRTQYRTREVLVGPVIDPDSGSLVGVIQVINNKAMGRFSDMMADALRGLCNAVGAAIARAVPEMVEIRTKYDFLVADGLISKADLEAVGRSARQEGLDIESLLKARHQIGKDAVGAALSKYFGVPYESYRDARPPVPSLYTKLKRDYILSKQWLPLESLEKSLLVMCLDPEQVMGSRNVAQVFPDLRPIYRVTTIEDFNSTLDQMLGPGEHVGKAGLSQQKASKATQAANDAAAAAVAAAPQADYLNRPIEELISQLENLAAAAQPDDEDEDTGKADTEDNELVRLVNKIITDAYRQNVSDIHIEPGLGKNKVLVRVRKDGSLVKYVEIPAAYRNALVARLKVMCDLDISERRKPQDGKIKFKKFSKLDIELRVATLPTTGGLEDVVMRILAAGEPIPLDKLGVLPTNLDRLISCVSKPYGLFFVCGPTGSGKTTTLHSVLKYLNTPDTKIWTAEDPVEITQTGLRQCQINKKAGLDFPVIMKAFLRADPDIIMVGEMRDADTTGIGIEASLTGHLVFATLHTNSAPESVIRLLDMGMDPFNFADALLGILAQRLAKRLCKCKEAYTPDDDEVRLFLDEYCSELVHTAPFQQDAPAARQAVYQRLLKDYGTEGKFVLYRAKGCGACDQTGYKGRLGLHELMVGTDPVKKLIQEHARVAQLFAQALEDGMLTLKMDGMEKVLQGITDMKQVRAVCIK
jgi:type II secretory ATPase GspE/PulE/Tfp pilus assembly ATPase PilB-like protein